MELLKNILDQDFMQIKLFKGFKVLDSRLRGNDINEPCNKLGQATV